MRGRTSKPPLAAEIWETAGVVNIQRGLTVEGRKQNSITLPTSRSRDPENFLPPARCTRSTPIRAQRAHLIAHVHRQMGLLTPGTALGAKVRQRQVVKG